MIFKNIFLLISWTLCILFLTLIPGETIPNVPIFGIDKVVHFILFGVEMFLMLNSINNLGYKSRKATIASFLLCIALGITIEFIQEFVPGRSSSLYDVIANTIGVVLGYYALKIFTAIKN